MKLLQEVVLFPLALAVLVLLWTRVLPLSHIQHFLQVQYQLVYL
jgi:hypothetical protein